MIAINEVKRPTTVNVMFGLQIAILGYIWYGIMTSPGLTTGLLIVSFVLLGIVPAFLLYLFFKGNKWAYLIATGYISVQAILATISLPLLFFKAADSGTILQSIGLVGLLSGILVFLVSEEVVEFYFKKIMKPFDVFKKVFLMGIATYIVIYLGSLLTIMMTWNTVGHSVQQSVQGDMLERVNKHLTANSNAKTMPNEQLEFRRIDK